MEKWIFDCRLSAGDIVMLTAAVRELHQAYPDRFVTDVRTFFPALWENNPYITPLNTDEPGVSSLQCHYPLVHKSNQAPYHFIHGFAQYIGEKLGVSIPPSAFKGDIHLAKEEEPLLPLVEDAFDIGSPYWVIVAGGKYDFTIKWWHRRRWQGVVDRCQGRVPFVQVGRLGDYHPPLKGVLDLRGKTSLRQLIRLIYHADGVVCPVTFHMHLAAAIPLPAGRRRLRSCVVVAGGREPAHWEQYPGHHFLHTVGALECCAAGGCWRARTAPLGDGAKYDQSLCLDVTEMRIPRCMHMITEERVAETVLLCAETSNSFRETSQSKSLCQP